MTATEQIIKDAINGGFMKQDGMVFVISNKEMFYVDQENPPFGAGSCRTIKLTSNEEKYLLMPTFWQAVGKTRGWREKTENTFESEHTCWQAYWTGFYGHVADGLTIEDSLTKISQI